MTRLNLMLFAFLHPILKCFISDFLFSLEYLNEFDDVIHRLTRYF